MGHYFWKVEHDVNKTCMDIKIETLPTELVNDIYKKGWVYQNVMMNKEGHIHIAIPAQYPIFIFADVNELIGLFEKYKKEFNKENYWEMIDTLHAYTDDETITIEVS